MSELKPGDDFSGFKVISVMDLEEYKGRGILLRHIRTGCELYHILCDDDENFFSFNFKTPSRDNTGAAHILEHSVLSGSEKYPIKDPFQALMQGSMNTFMNAMTYPDKTIYPAATTVKRDYFNIMSVYGDSVFFPLLRMETFRQEGHRIEFDENEQLKIGGVVYNEMTGAYAEKESIVNEWAYRSLFTNSPYRFDSGGVPESIPDLTYKDFIDYHRTFYHPSNCRIFLYGNIPTEEQLTFIEKNFLSVFKKKDVDSAVCYQERWKSPKYIEKFCSSADGENPEGRTIISINWLIGDTTDSVNLLSTEILAEILLGSAGAPMQTAILDSGLGEDISPVSGLEADLLEMVFSLGVRGTSPDKVKPFEDLVFGELRKLATEGIPEDAVEGALKRVEFRNREIRGGAPFGLRLMGKALRGWLHGCSPETTLRFSAPMEDLKKRIAGNPRYFEECIERSFLSNPHRTIVVVKPDLRFEEKRKENDARYLPRKITMPNSEISEIKDSTGKLRIFQDTPDSFEDLKKVPSLHLSDLPPDIHCISTRSETLGTVPLYTHDLFTNGIVYIDLAFNLNGIDESLFMYLPLFSRVICGSGFPGVPYDEVARQLSIKTGGIFTFLESGSLPAQPGDLRDYLFLRLKSLEETLPDAVSLLKKLLFESRLDDRKRIKDLLLEQRNDYRSAVLSMGSALAALRASAGLAPSIAKEESWRGIGQYLFLNDLAEAVDDNIELVMENLQKIRDFLFTRNRLVCNITADKHVFPDIRMQIASLSGCMPQGESITAVGGKTFNGNSGFETLTASTDVGFNALAIPSSGLESAEHAYEQVLAHLLKTEYLWEKVRMKGGAYGVSASTNGLDSVFIFTSYRDPGIIDTLRNFIEGLEYYSKKGADSAAIEKAVISIVGKSSRPMSPGEKSLIGFRRELYGITDNIRRNIRYNILHTGGEMVSAAAALLLERKKLGMSVVFAGPAAVKEASLKEKKIIENVIQIPL